MIYWIAYVIVKLVSKVLLPCTFTGKEHLPVKGSYILASNHISNLDPLVLGISCWRRFSYVAKDTLFQDKFSNFFLHQVGAFPIKRNTSDFRALRETLKRLKEGCPVIVFPEGQRKGGGKKPAAVEPGIGLIAVRSGVPVIPAYIRGTDQAMPPGARWIKRHPVYVKFGRPLYFLKGQSYPEIAEQIMDQLLSLNS